MGKVLNHPKADVPAAIYPGVADVNREGVAIAFEMLCELESGAVVDPEAHIRIAELSELENWPREGKPFRNVVYEYLTRAKQSGPAVEAGFCAVLSDFVAQVLEGGAPSAHFYANLYNL